MKWCLFAFALALCTTGAHADKYTDCSEGTDIVRQIIGCTQIIEERAHEPRKNRSLAYVYRGLAYFFKRDFERAITDYNTAIALDPSNANAYNNRATIHFQKGDYVRSIADLTRAIEIKPTAVYLANRAKLHSELGQLDRALADYTAAMEFKANSAIAPDPNAAAANSD